jgi:ribosomal subunit interface protein
MQLLYYAPKLTAPTIESLQQYTQRRFAKLSRFVPRLGHSDFNIKISVEKRRHVFVLSVEVPLSRPVYIQVEHSNLYAAIDNAYDVIKKTIRRAKEKQRG